MMKPIFRRIYPFGTSLLLPLLFVLLMGCSTTGRVRPSFTYAFFGTFLIMIVAVVIATVVTRRAKEHGREE
jgi:Kef-type K+ transport system membrane component KefB